MPYTVSSDELELLVHGGHGHPHAVLGPHPGDGGVTVRIFSPLAATVPVVYDDPKGEEGVHLDHEYAGIWAGELPGTDVPDYRVGSPTARARPRATTPTASCRTPRRAGPPSDQRGPPRAAVDRPGFPRPPLRGARHRDHSGHRLRGLGPAARGVRMKGAFNSWDGREHPMRQLGASGIWELFVPDVGSGTGYKFAILGADDLWRQKADPMAFHTENPAGHVLGRLRVEVHLGRRRLDGRPRRPAGGARADVGLRDPPRLVAASTATAPRTHLRRSSPTTWSPTWPTSASPTWSSCR